MEGQSHYSVGLSGVIGVLCGVVGSLAITCLPPLSSKFNGGEGPDGGILTLFLLVISSVGGCALGMLIAWRLNVTMDRNRS